MREESFVRAGFLFDFRRNGALVLILLRFIRTVAAARLRGVYLINGKFRW